MLNAPPQPLRVLLVEDNPGDARLLEVLLAETAQASFQIVKCAGRLSEAIEFLDRHAPDLVLLDLSLPDSAGANTFEKIHAHAPGVPLIVLSGLDDEEFALHTMQQGAQDYLVKGRFDGHLLVRSMRYAVERFRAEATLASERNLLRNLLDNLPDYIYAKDAEGHYVIDNVSHMRLLNLQSTEEVVGKTVFDFFPEEIARRYHADDQAIIASGKTLLNREEPGKSTDGSPRWLATTKVPLHDERGRVTGLVCIGRDITEGKLAEERLKKANAELSKNREELLAALDRLRRAHEELRSVQLQLIEAEKMKSIGRLAAGVAHEVKNPLAIITMGIHYLEQQKFADEAVPAILRDLHDAVKRADAVIRGLLDFSAPQQLDAGEEDLNDIIERSLVLMRGETNSTHIRVVTDLQAGLPRLKLDRLKIGQVFVNIFTNAVHAMEAGGTLTVRTYAKQLTGVGQNVGDTRSELFRVGQTLVVAEIDDTGHGVPEDRLHKVFDPFFTTKATGKGTGLGLSVSKTIIDLHGGTIDIRNLPEGGARVTVTLRTG